MKRCTSVLLLLVACVVAAAGVVLFGSLIFYGPSGVEQTVEMASLVASMPGQMISDVTKPDEITLDIEETPGILSISNYPMIELGSSRYTKDEKLSRQALDLLNGRSFKRWDGWDAYERRRGSVNGGYYTTLKLYSSDGKLMRTVNYNPEYAKAGGGDGVYIQDGGVTYILEGDQQQVIDFLDRCVMDAYDQTCLPRRLHAMADLLVHGYSRMRCPGPPNREARARQKSRERDHHKGAPLRWFSVCLDL